MNENYFFGINNQQVGPLDAKSIQQRIRDGSITRNTPAWCQGMDNWRPLNDIPELVKTFGELLAQQVRPPPLTSGPATPPPLQSASNTIPSGLSQLEASAYKFVVWCYRPWLGRPSQIREYVEKDHKRAVPVAAATMGVCGILVMMSLANMSGAAKPQQSSSGAMQQQVPMSANNFQANQRAWQDAHDFSMGVMDDVYKYKRDAGDRMDDTYRRATYDWYNDKN